MIVCLQKDAKQCCDMTGSWLNSCYETYKQGGRELARHSQAQPGKQHDKHFFGDRVPMHFKIEKKNNKMGPYNIRTSF